MQRLCADKKLLLAYLIVIDYKFDFLEVVSASLRQGEHNLRRRIDRIKDMAILFRFQTNVSFSYQIWAAVCMYHT